jgi:glycosyltransferase involved in cell wall biosynthesis
MAIASFKLLRRLRKLGRCDVIDAHFAYPDGYCAAQLGRWLSVPVSITLRGTEPRYLAHLRFRRRVLSALHSVQRIFTVSDSLRQLAVAAGIPEERIRVIGNGVDTDRFRPFPKDEARAILGLPRDAKILITVGGLVERKGFHRVLAELPLLIEEFPKLIYLSVGGPSPEGDWSDKLRQLAAEIGVDTHVRFLGRIGPDKLCEPLSASDAFVLPSSNEGWANVILEAMACGIPVIASDVGGNAEVVSRADLGLVYPFEKPQKLIESIQTALRRDWDRETLVRYAESNTWESRVATLVEEFSTMMSHDGTWLALTHTDTK